MDEEKLWQNQMDKKIQRNMLQIVPAKYAHGFYIVL